MSPGLRMGLDRSRMAAAFGAAVLAVIALSSAIRGIAVPGVVTDLPGGTVQSVSPWGYAWRDGIRPRQTVVSIRDSAQPGGWSLQTMQAGNLVVTRSAEHDRSLRASQPLALGALAFALLAILLPRRARNGVAAAVATSVLLASVPLGILGDPPLSAVGLGAALAVPAGWLVNRLQSKRIVAALAGLVAAAFLAVWFVARSTGSDSADALEAVRGALSVAATTCVVVAIVGGPLVRRNAALLATTRAVDLASAATATGIGLALVLIVRLDPLLVGALALIVLGVYPRIRRVAALALSSILLADIREQAAITATEEERGRISRDLHDLPLQQIVGVIHQLDAVPSAREGVEMLRGVANQLRGIATDLRLPMLDDFGLVAALTFLAEQSSSLGIAVTCRLSQPSAEGHRGRPPAPVELAAFRIVQEAVHNALRHSGGHHIEIVGLISSDVVELEIVDDGRGFTAADAEQASRQGRLGLSSMRQRATLIDAELTIEHRQGTLVALRWSKR